jgi:hypothetical protein
MSGGNAVSGWSAVALGWGASVALVGGYVAVLLRRGRTLARRLRPEDRRWM